MNELNENSLAFPALKLTRKIGNEQFTLSGKPLDFQLIEFWQWSVSDLTSNATRGRLAEFLVATALNLTNGVRNEWDAFDLLLPNGTKLEIKSAAYLQSWSHAKLSAINFKIRQTFAWDSNTNKSSTESARQADIYVFCLLKHTDKATIDPMNLDQWEFYLLPTKVLNEKFPTQKSIGLSSLMKLQPVISSYENLAKRILQLAEEINFR